MRQVKGGNTVRKSYQKRQRHGFTLAELRSMNTSELFKEWYKWDELEKSFNRASDQMICYRVKSKIAKVIKEKAGVIE